MDVLRGGLGRAHARDLLPPGRRVPRPAGADAAVPANRAWRKGEDLKRINAGAQGSMLDFIEAFTRRLPERVDEYETLLTDNRIWKQRTVDIGVVTPERAHARGACPGPMLRGSGIEWDLRKKQPYAVYDRDGFRHPGRRQRRLLRPLPRARRGDAPVEPHHQAVRGVAARESGPGDDRQPQGRAAVARSR